MRVIENTKKKLNKTVKPKTNISYHYRRDLLPQISDKFPRMFPVLRPNSQYKYHFKNLNKTFRMI